METNSSTYARPFHYISPIHIIITLMCFLWCSPRPHMFDEQCVRATSMVDLNLHYHRQPNSTRLTRRQCTTTKDDVTDSFFLFLSLISLGFPIIGRTIACHPPIRSICKLTFPLTSATRTVISMYSEEFLVYSFIGMDEKP